MKRLIVIFSFCFPVVSLTYAQSDSLSQERIIQSRIPLADTLTIESVEAGSADPVLKTNDYVVVNQADTSNVLDKDLLKSSGFLPPASLMIYALTIQGRGGLYSSYNIRQDMRSTFPGFYTPIDNYLQYAPLVAAYATGFIPGTKPRHSNGRRLWMFIQAQVLTTVAVQALKHYTHEFRPNGSDYLSFPSGHAAQAFMGATLFDVEYPNQMKGVKIGLYALAAFTGMLRMMNDDHWANDVLFGAGIGMLSVRLLYWSEQHWKKKKTFPR